MLPLQEQKFSKNNLNKQYLQCSPVFFRAPLNFIGHGHEHALFLTQRVRDSLVQERARLGAGLAAVPYLEPFPSAANFVLCRVCGGRDAKELKDALAQRHGIMVC